MNHRLVPFFAMFAWLAVSAVSAADDKAVTEGRLDAVGPQGVRAGDDEVVVMPRLAHAYQDHVAEAEEKFPGQAFGAADFIDEFWSIKEIRFLLADVRGDPASPERR